MKRYEHCRRCREKLGAEFREVHEWLDALCHVPRSGGWVVDEDTSIAFDPYHRKYRHNLVGVAHVVFKFGKDAGEAAMLHICDDLGCKTEDIPIDEADYVRKGFV